MLYAPRIIYTCHLGSFLFNIKRQTKLRVFHFSESVDITSCYVLLCFALLWLLFYLLFLVNRWLRHFSSTSPSFFNFLHHFHVCTISGIAKTTNKNSGKNINSNKTVTAFFGIFHQASHSQKFHTIFSIRFLAKCTLPMLRQMIFGG